MNGWEMRHVNNDAVGYCEDLKYVDGNGVVSRVSSRYVGIDIFTAIQTCAIFSCTWPSCID